MGNALAAFASIFKKKDVRIAMIGLDAAGKTTILFKLKLNEVSTTIPTIGFNVETIEHKNLKMSVWDLGGQDRVRALWSVYYQNCNGIIYVVDCNDHDRIQIAKDSLHRVMNDKELENASLLVFANKQDISGALNASAVINVLDLKSLKQKWFVQPTSALSGSGLREGLDWLAGAIK